MVFYSSFRPFAKLLSLPLSAQLNALLEDIPPKSLTIAGPLVPVFQNLAVSQPKSSRYNIVTPMYQRYGPEHARELISTDYAIALCLPNVPLLLHLLDQLKNGNDNAPIYYDGNYFRNDHARVILGNQFNADNWTQQQRFSLLTPGLIQTPESDEILDQQFRHLIEDVDLPVPTEDDDLRTPFKFTYTVNPGWLAPISRLMNVYNSQFSDKTTLSSIALTATASGLIKSEMTTLTSADAANNISNTVDKMFPDVFPKRYSYSFRSTEYDVPLPLQLSARYAAVNSTLPNQNLAHWNRINTADPCPRNGPYWNQIPNNLELTSDESFYEVENIIDEYYFKHTN